MVVLSMELTGARQGRIAEAEIPKLKLLRAAASSSTNDALSFVQPTNTEVHLACTRKRLCLHARTPNDQMFTRPLPVCFCPLTSLPTVERGAAEGDGFG